MSEHSDEWDTLYQEAEALAAAGREEAARQRLKQVLRLNDHHLAAWALLARLAQSTREEAFCLRRVLHIDPQQQWAQQRLQQLTQSNPELAEPSAPPTHPSAPHSKPSTDAPRKRRKLDPATIFFLAALLIFVASCIVTAIATVVREPTALAQTAVLITTQTTNTALQGSGQSCEALIAAAVQASDQGCGRVGANEACYGNNTLDAQLADTASTSFEERGDIVSIDSLLSLDASPLNLDANEWGIAIFKLVANLPRTLPGQNVTFIVFGDTTVNNASGDMQAFYFASQLGQIACDSVSLDNGLFIHMPEGSGIVFSANGSEITLMGSAALEAHRNEEMTISIVDGNASITADGQTAYVAAGQQVQVPLGGADGLNPAGPPSDPVNLSPDALALACALTGANCGVNAVATGDPTQAVLAIAQAQATSTPGGTASSAPTLAPSQTPGQTGTGTKGPSVTGSRTPTRTSTAGLSATLSRTPTGTTSGTPASTATATRTPTLTPTSGGASPTPSSTPTATRTLTRTPSPTQTSTRTPSPSASPSPTPTATGLPSSTPTPTATPTPSLTSAPTSTPTPTPTPTHTPTPTETLAPTATDTPTLSPTPACDALSAGSLITSGTTVDLSIANNGTNTVTISGIDIVWPDVPVQQKLEGVLFGGQTISASANDPLSPTNLPGDMSWSGEDRSLAGSSSKTLQFIFSDSLSGSSTVSVTFDNGCTLNAGP